MNKDVSPSQKPERPDDGPAKKMDFSTARARFYIALGLSILFHLSLGGGLVLTPKADFAKNHSKTSVELMTPEEMKALLAQSKKDTPITGKQIVETDKNRINDEIDPNAKYLSQHDQRVIKETRAAQTGKFTNDAGQGRQQAAAAPPQAPNASDTETKNKTNDKAAEDQASNSESVDAELQAFEHGDVSVAAKKGLQKFNPSFRKLPVVPDPTAEQQAVGDGHDVSKTDDHLKVPTGMQTMLSTREFVYYSYYNRIKDKLRQYWEPKIKEKFEKTMREGRSIASEGDKITKIVIILDDKGTLIRVQVISASGLIDLDEAAVEAFRAAAPFPNPPKGIVEEDGTIKIRWDFVLEA